MRLVAGSVSPTFYPAGPDSLGPRGTFGYLHSVIEHHTRQGGPTQRDAPCPYPVFLGHSTEWIPAHLPGGPGEDLAVGIQPSSRILDEFTTTTRIGEKRETPPPPPEFTSQNEPRGAGLWLPPGAHSICTCKALGTHASQSAGSAELTLACLAQTQSTTRGRHLAPPGPCKETK